MLDVLGGDDFLSDATHRLGSRGHVLDRKLAPRYDVSRPIVLTTLQQDVSAGKCVARMISPPRQHNSCSPNVISASAAIAKKNSSCSNALHAFDSGTPVFHVCGTRRKSKLFSHGLGHCGFLYVWISMQITNVFLVGTVDSKDLHRIARKCFCEEWTLQCFRTKTFSSEGFRINARVLFFT